LPFGSQKGPERVLEIENPKDHKYWRVFFVRNPMFWGIPMEQHHSVAMGAPLLRKVLGVGVPSRKEFGFCPVPNQIQLHLQLIGLAAKLYG